MQKNIIKNINKNNSLSQSKFLQITIAELKVNKSLICKKNTQNWKVRERIDAAWKLTENSKNFLWVEIFAKL